jgi:hypothetical protein
VICHDWDKKDCDEKTSVVAAADQADTPGGLAQAVILGNPIVDIFILSFVCAILVLGETIFTDVGFWALAPFSLFVAIIYLRFYFEEYDTIFNKGP